MLTAHVCLLLKEFQLREGIELALSPCEMPPSTCCCLVISDLQLTAHVCLLLKEFQLKEGIEFALSPCEMPPSTCCGLVISDLQQNWMEGVGVSASSWVVALGQRIHSQGLVDLLGQLDCNSLFCGCHCTAGIGTCPGW